MDDKEENKPDPGDPKNHTLVKDQQLMHEKLAGGEATITTIRIIIIIGINDVEMDFFSTRFEFQRWTLLFCLLKYEGSRKT